MPIRWTILLTATALMSANAIGKPAAQKVAPPATLSVTLNQGEVARWPGIAARSCVLGAKKYPAVDAVCYFPFDVEAAPGRHPIAVIDQDGKRHNATAIVEKVERPKVDINLTDDAYINVSHDNQKRAALEREAVLTLFAATIEEPQFSLPLGAPASPLPKNEDAFRQPAHVRSRQGRSPAHRPRLSGQRGQFSQGDRSRQGRDCR